MDPVLFLVLQLKNHHLFSCVGVDMSTPAQAYKSIFRPEKGFNKNSVNIWVISARHTTNKLRFKKVTCPFQFSKPIFFASYIHKFSGTIDIYRNDNFDYSESIVLHMLLYIRMMYVCM